jgi:hypothetical protein
VMSSLHAALGLAGIGAQNLDVELRQSTAELGDAVSAGGGAGDSSRARPDELFPCRRPGRVMIWSAPCGSGAVQVSGSSGARSQPMVE